MLKKVFKMSIRKCIDCNSYTLQKKCPNCGSKTRSPHPAKFSPEDKYGEYRRKEKINQKDG